MYILDSNPSCKLQDYELLSLKKIKTKNIFLSGKLKVIAGTETVQTICLIDIFEGDYLKNRAEMGSSDLSFFKSKWLGPTTTNNPKKYALHIATKISNDIL